MPVAWSSRVASAECRDTTLIGCTARPRRSTLPNLKVYRIALVVGLVLVVASLFTLGRPETPKLSGTPVTFDGARAAADMRLITTEFPKRRAGSDADHRCGIWLLEQFELLGLETHVQGFPASVEGSDVALQNVWAESRGAVNGTILVVANRDTPPSATQGANNNASGVAALLELARSFTVTAHDHTVVFLATTGDAFGALGARRFLEAYEGKDDLMAVLVLSKMATRERDGLAVDGWSTEPMTAPPWLWLLTSRAARVHANQEALLPGVVAQIVRLAAPTSHGSQGPFVAAGIPAVTITQDGPSIPAQNDILDNVSAETLGRSGAAAEAMVLAVDAGPLPEERSGGTIFLTRQRTLPGGALQTIMLAFFLPLLAVTVDLFAHCRREKVRLRPAILRAALHLAPWLIALVLVYLANLLGILPRSPGAVVPPDSPLVAEPRYLHVLVLLAALVVAALYAGALERRLARKVPTDPRATIFIAHASLLAVAVAAALVNPYSVLLVMPAALLWPLARPGVWARSLAPAYLGLVMIPVVLIYFAASLDVGWNVWWYFLLLVETRTIPPSAVLLGMLFLSTTGVLAGALRERGPDAEDLRWGHAELQSRGESAIGATAAASRFRSGLRRRWSGRRRAARS